MGSIYKYLSSIMYRSLTNLICVFFCLAVLILVIFYFFNKDHSRHKEWKLPKNAWLYSDHMVVSDHFRYS